MHCDVTPFIVCAFVKISKENTLPVRRTQFDTFSAKNQTVGLHDQNTIEEHANNATYIVES